MNNQGAANPAGEQKYRIQKYEAYRPLDDLSAELGVSSFNAYENITGIYFEEGESVEIDVGECGQESLALKVKDWSKVDGDEYCYPLQKGTNTFEMKGCGNGYIEYFTANFATARPVEINIKSGKVNGYIDYAKTTVEEAQNLLDNAASSIMDLRSDYVALAYSVDSLKRYAHDDPIELLGLYDDIVGCQYRIAGYIRYNRVPKNRMFGRVIYNGFMHADGIGAAFNINTMKELASADAVREGKAAWGIAHEFGHVNQLRPGMKWVGTTEVTNNIFSVVSQYELGSGWMRLEHENVGGEVGGRFNAYLNNALVNNQEWGLQGGPDSPYGETERGWGADHFVKLCMLWQLHLYYVVAGEGSAQHRPDFWADIFEAVRLSGNTEEDNGQLQVNFAKNAIAATQQNLVPFFKKTGVLVKIDKYIDDYTNAQKTITDEMIAEVEEYAEQFPLPDAAIEFISVNSIEAYLERNSVLIESKAGAMMEDGKYRIPHGECKNAVAFKLYRDDCLESITMCGTGSPENQYTVIDCVGEGASKITAVSFDGTEVDVAAF